MHSFRWGRLEVWILIILSLLLLVAALHMLLQNNRVPSGSSYAQTTSPADTARPHSKGTYAPPTQLPKPARTTTQSVELSADYVGLPARPESSSIPKLSPGMQIDLNQADTAELQQVPGIGPSFARRIAKYRDRLGGYYTVLQLQEIFGMDADRYRQIKPYFYIGVTNYSTPFASLRSDSIPSHPYLNYRQQGALARSIRKNGAIDSWHRIMSLQEFNRDDSVRLSHYFHF